MSDEITIARENAVLKISLNRPDRLNSVTTAVLNDLADLIEEAGGDSEIRVVVLTGEGRAFSSGADLKQGTDTNAPPGTDTILSANRVIRALRTVPQPTVAAVNGPAVGVGCSLALGCDLVVAAENAYFLLSFTNIGLMPDGGATALVPASIGRSRALAMALAAERISAPEALSWGLIYKVVEADALQTAVTALAERLASGAPLAYAATKRAINDATLSQLEPAFGREIDGQGRLLGSSDFFEAVVAFGEKRPPKFTGS
jgi:enoyl-CoA hydratase